MKPCIVMPTDFGVGGGGGNAVENMVRNSLLMMHRLS